MVVVDHVGRLAALGNGEVAELCYELWVHRPLRLDALALLDGRFALGLKLGNMHSSTNISVPACIFLTLRPSPTIRVWQNIGKINTEK